MRALLAAFLFAPGFASAAEVSGAANLKIVADVILYACPLFGMFLVASGVYQFYTYAVTGDRRSGSIGNSFARLFAGVFLTSIQWVYALLASSFMIKPNEGYFTNSNGRATLAVDQMAVDALSTTGLGATTTGVPTQTLTTIFAFLFVFGLLAFINGVYKLHTIGSGNADPRELNMAVMRMVGGMCCMNITSVSCTVSSFLGLSLLCAG